MENSGLEIRHAVVADAPQIQKITVEAFNSYIELAGIGTNIAALTETIEDIERDIREKIVLVAYVGDEIMGSVRVELTGAQTAYLSRFGVNPNHQNLGIGKELMNFVDIKMKAVGVKKLYLHTGAKIKSLVIFYYRQGFYIESTATDRGYIRAKLCKEY